MSNMVIPNEGKAVALAAILGKTAAATPLTLRLFSNNHTPAAGDTNASYTEVSGGGYAAFAFTAARWSITSADPSVATYASHSFTFTGVIGGSGNVYGYYITDNNNKVIAGQRLDSPPYTPAVNGDSVVVNPLIDLETLV